MAKAALRTEENGMIGSSLYIEVNAHAGSPGEKVCRDLVALANIIETQASLKFNDVRVSARPGDDPAALWASLLHFLGSKEPYRIATARHGHQILEQAT